VTGRRGFTLLELIVATTIMGVAVVTLLSGISGSTRVASRLRDYDRLVQLARLRMNDLLVQQRQANAPLTGRFDPADTGGTEAGWQAKVSRFESPPMASEGQYVLERVELEVWWMAGGDRRSFTLDSYRRRQITGADLVAGGF
jgi:general secretion pathway protein I